MPQYNTLLKLLATILLLSIVGACASLGPTEPNDLFAGPYPDKFNQLTDENPLLAKEIGKLPELQDGISDSEAKALERLCDMYADGPESFDKTFNEMYKIGKPEVRKYCAPLQSLFWLIEDGKLDTARDILKDYSLNKLLSAAWGFHFEPLPFSDEQISVIIDNVNDKKMQKLYSTSKNDIEFLQKIIIFDYDYRPEKFKRKARKIIRKVKSENEDVDIRWVDFNTVVERLNSPELVNYYEQTLIHWVDWRTLPTWPVSPSYVFRYRKGDCTAIADFTALCLQKAGYKAYEYKVAARRPVDTHHSICIFFVDGIKYVMDNGDTLQRGIFLYDEN